MLQCLIFVNDMYILSKPKIQNIFSEDVAYKLDEHDISYGRDLPIVGKVELFIVSTFYKRK